MRFSDKTSTMRSTLIKVQEIYHPLYSLLGFSFAGLLYLWPFNNCECFFLHPKL